MIDQKVIDRRIKSIYLLNPDYTNAYHSTCALPPKQNKITKPTNQPTNQPIKNSFIKSTGSILYSRTQPHFSQCNNIIQRPSSPTQFGSGPIVVHWVRGAMDDCICIHAMFINLRCVRSSQGQVIITIHVQQGMIIGRNRTVRLLLSMTRFLRDKHSRVCSHTSAILSVSRARPPLGVLGIHPRPNVVFSKDQESACGESILNFREFPASTCPLFESTAIMSRQWHIAIQALPG